MFTIALQQVTGGCTPASVTLDFGWTSFTDPDTCAMSTFPQLTWTNPCDGAFAISYYYEVWYVGLPDTLQFTSGGFTGTVDPGVTAFPTETVGPVPTPLHGNQDTYLLLYVTWPDTVTRLYTSFTDDVNGCH